MSNVLNTLEFTIRNLLNAKQHLLEIAALEAIAEYIDIDNLQCESVVHEV
jgi:hypothetical protein